MKKILLYVLTMAMAFSACTEEDVVQVGDIVSPTVSSAIAGKDVVLSYETEEDAFTTLSWKAASFGFQSADPDYYVQIDLKSNNFSAPVNIAVTTDLSIELINKVVNQALLNKDAVAGEAVAVQFRVMASIHDDYSAISNVIECTVTPYEQVVKTYKALYVTSDYNNWDFDEEYALYAEEGTNVYTGYVYLANGEEWAGFKFSTQMNWDDYATIYGDVDAAGNTGTLAQETDSWGTAQNIFATEGAGVYYVTADLDAMTYTVELTNWAITGDFNGWSFSEMDFNTETNQLEITTSVTAGGFKFIANEDWGWILGDEEADGILDPGTDGNNIMIENAGYYIITLDLSSAEYTYTITESESTGPMVTELYISGDNNEWGFDEQAVLYGLSTETAYSGYVYLDKNTTFKFSTLKSWNSASAIYGDTDEAGTSGVLVQESDDWNLAKSIVVADSGLYYVTADLGELTYALTSTSWAITGDFNSWGFTPLTYNVANNTLSVTLDLTEGGFKFIANENWDWMLGDTGADGILDPGTDGNNIWVEAGNYTITLNLGAADYTYTVVKN